MGRPEALRELKVRPPDGAGRGNDVEDGAVDTGEVWAGEAGNRIGYEHVRKRRPP